MNVLLLLNILLYNSSNAVFMLYSLYEILANVQIKTQAQQVLMKFYKA